MYSNWLRWNQRWFSLLAGVILAAGIATGSAQQSGPTLTSLTVPENNLPDGCRLRPYVPPTTSVVRDGKTMVMSNPGTSFPFPANPWSGADRKLVAAVHRAIDATQAKPLPDVPLPEPHNAAVSELKWADNIIEAYHAAYASVDGGHAEVFAVTFNDVKLATTSESISAMLNPPGGITARIVRGATVVRVSAPIATECFRAVRAHMELLK